MLRVLVVDDSPLDRRLVGGLLEKRLSPIEVRYATDGRDALGRLEGVELVLTDLQMPEMDGLALVRALRATHGQLPVVLMTAHGSEDIAVRALREGAASYVPKSNLARDLASTVQGVLEVVRQGREAQTASELLRSVSLELEVPNDPALVPAVVGYLERHLAQLALCDETERLQVGVALREAIMNAIVHGNLEVRSELLDEGGDAFGRAIGERGAMEPYASRRARVSAKLDREQASFVVGDDGPGFDPSTLPDPLDPSNLERSHGRGLLLIRTFMDEVAHARGGRELRMTKRRTGSPARREEPS